jgi:Na+/proline symporter
MQLLITQYHPLVFPSILFAYFLILVIIGRKTAGNSDNATFFKGNRSSPWFLVAFGMIGASLSGVTFLSIPGAVFKDGFSYMQMVFGYFAGYMVIVFVLLPLYYKLNLTSIYTYLQNRFGNAAYKTGAFYFLLSRSIGSALRLFLVAVVLQAFISDNLGIPFELTVFFTIVLIWLYSFRGGIKTIVYTDTLQTLFMLIALGISIVYLLQDDQNLFKTVRQSDFSQWFVSNPDKKNFFLKHFLGGMFITIVMTGLDQDMMQKSLTCKNLKDAQKNVFWTSILLIPVNLLFLSLGALLYLYGFENNIISSNPGISEEQISAIQSGKVLLFQHSDGIVEAIKTDQVFPYLSVNYLPGIAAIFFFIGLVAAAYSTADSALTSLTTSFCIDFLGFSEIKGNRKVRQMVHIGFSLLLFVIILIFKSLNSDAVINELFKIAGFTYGPLLGMFSFGILTQRRIQDKFIPIICILSPILCYILDINSQSILNGYTFGFELLILNGFITFVLLGMLPRPIEEE